MNLQGLLDSIRGWIPRDITPSYGGQRPARFRGKRMLFSLELFFFEFVVLFLALSVAQLIGLGVYSGFIAGGLALPITLIGLALFWPKKVEGFFAHVGDLDLQPLDLTHIIEWLGRITIEGELKEPDQQPVLNKISSLQRGDPLQYSLISDKGRITLGTGSVQRVITKKKSGGKVFFSITIRRAKEDIRH